MQQNLSNGHEVGMDRRSEGDWLAMRERGGGGGGGEKRYSPLPLLDREKYVVRFDDDEEEEGGGGGEAKDGWNPQNWPSWKK